MNGQCIENSKLRKKYKEDTQCRAGKQFLERHLGKGDTIQFSSRLAQEIRRGYCKHVEPKEYTLTMEIFKKVLARMTNNKAPGADLIIMLWIKRLSATHPYLLRILKEVMVGEADILSWLVIMKTMLTLKNQEYTHRY